MVYRPKKFQKQSENGIDDWLMTYADMITLLLCFFAVFLSVSVPKKEVFKQAREKLLERFSRMEKEFLVIRPSDTKTLRTDGLLDGLPAFAGDFHKGEGQHARDGLEGKTGKNSGQEQKPEGDRIITLEIPSATFFESGSATLSDNGKRTLQNLLSQKIQTKAFEDYQITIEGHTDDVPIKTLQFPSNWELSTARAASVIRYFIAQGLAPEKLRASGYADSHPKFPNHDPDGKPLPENQAQNRRVVIKLEKIEKNVQ